MASLRSVWRLRTERERGTEEMPVWRVMVWLVEAGGGVWVYSL